MVNKNDRGSLIPHVPKCVHYLAHLGSVAFLSVVKIHLERSSLEQRGSAGADQLDAFGESRISRGGGVHQVIGRRATQRGGQLGAAGPGQFFRM